MDKKKLLAFGQGAFQYTYLSDYLFSIGWKSLNG